VGDVRVGVDVGGTFTDLVALVDGQVVSAKVPSTPRDQAQGVMHAIGLAELAAERVAVIAHGSTVATNALLERGGARTALVTTEGFRDVIEIGRQHRPALYDLTRDRPPPLVPRELRFTVRERMGPGGVLVPLDEASLAEAVEACRAAGVDAVAVCLLFGFLHPAHELRVGAALRDALPGVHVSLSCQVLPEFREFERCATTVADAYLTPRLGAYLRSLSGQLRQRALPGPMVMQSSGGVAEVEEAAAHAAACVLSGPAGGVVGAAWIAGLSGHRDLLTFDMGGTSTDVALVRGGSVSTTNEAVVGGVPIRLPVVDIHSVSAGGGSIAWVDDGGSLRVGPRSAGADPGPAAYGRGGSDSTVTDANLALGYLADGAVLGGEVRLDRARAETALARLGERLGLDPHQAAVGVVRVANAEMTRALRVISVQRGIDPREHTLVAFGGAGGMHACALAEELGITRVLLPGVAGVLSALGLAIADLRRDYLRPFLGALDETDPEALEAAWKELEARASADAGAGGSGSMVPRPEAPQADPTAAAGPPDGSITEASALQLTRQADLRYHKQSFELTITAPSPDPGELAVRFHEAHERRYGYRMLEEPVELVNLRLVAVTPVEKPSLSTNTFIQSRSPTRRRASFDDRQQEVETLDRASLGVGVAVGGPAIVASSDATCVVRPGWHGVVDEVGSLLLERTREGV